MLAWQQAAFCFSERKRNEQAELYDKPASVVDTAAQTDS